MALIQKFTVVDPSIRASYSLKTSTHTLLKQYDLFYKDTYKEEATVGELVENMLLYVLKADSDFQRFIKKIPVGAAAELDEYMRRLTGRKATDEASEA